MGEAEVGQPEPLRRVCKTVCFFCKSATGGLGLGEGDGGWIHADLMVKGITERKLLSCTRKWIRCDNAVTIL